MSTEQTLATAELEAIARALTPLELAELRRVAGEMLARRQASEGTAKVADSGPFGVLD